VLHVAVQAHGRAEEEACRLGLHLGEHEHLHESDDRLQVAGARDLEDVHLGAQVGRALDDGAPGVLAADAGREDEVERRAAVLDVGAGDAEQRAMRRGARPERSENADDDLRTR